jgi:putative ABC transport system permease protein
MIAASLLMASFNIARTMEDVIKVERHAKNWAVEIKLNQTMQDDKLETLFSEISDVTRTESFKRNSASIIENDPEDVGDSQSINNSKRNSKAHKVPVTITDLKLGSNMLNLPMIEGNWFRKVSLTEGDKLAEPTIYVGKNPVVVSQLVMEHLPYLKIGMTLDIEILGKIKAFTLIGVARNIGPASIYTNGLFNSHVQKNGLFLSSDKQSRAELNQLKKRVVKHAEDNDIKLSYTSTAWDGAEVVEDHFQIIFALMLLLTVIIIFIASNGIILTMTTNIIERTRENGVLKAIGASNKDLAKMILSEAFLIAFIAWLVACIVTLPLSYGVAFWLGELLIKTPLSLSLNPMIFAISLPIMILVTSLASLIPMGKIMKLSVREALVYE